MPFKLLFFVFALFLGSLPFHHSQASASTENHLAAHHSNTSQAARQITSQKQLEAFATQWLNQQLTNQTTRYQLNFLNPSQNLTYAPCLSPLDIQAMGNKPLQGRLNLKISCLTEDWFTYLGVHIETFDYVVVAKSHLGRGAQLNPSFLQLKEVKTTGLNNDYFTRLEELTGKRLKSALRAGRVISSKNLEQALAVNKGDLVSLSSGGNRIRVEISAEALNSGSVGQQIRVKNLQTGKQIKALVVGPGAATAL